MELHHSTESVKHRSFKLFFDTPYAHGNRQRVLTLSAVEFVRRLLLHVLPTGFQRIRHYGILSNRHRHQKLALCRQLLGSGAAAESQTLETVKRPASPELVTPTRVCPICGAGRMIVLKELPPRPIGVAVGMGTGNDVCVVVDSS